MTSCPTVIYSCMVDRRVGYLRVCSARARYLTVLKHCARDRSDWPSVYRRTQVVHRIAFTDQANRGSRLLRCRNGEESLVEERRGAFSCLARSRWSEGRRRGLYQRTRKSGKDGDSQGCVQYGQGR